MKNVLSLIFFLLLGTFSTSYAASNTLNVYAWSGEIPASVIKQFEKETGINVNVSSFDNNEVMYAKLRTNSKGYDIAEPSSYYIQRMQRQNMLEPLDKTKLTHFNHLDPFFIDQSYDPKSLYSIPFVWGITGIFFNQKYIHPDDVTQWSDLFSPKFLDRLLLLNDSRAVFSMALRLLNYSINAREPHHLDKAYQKLSSLMPNVRLFNSDAILSILIDEDAVIGMACGADIYQVSKENPNVKFVFPRDGFEIWVDTFVLLKNAPHKENAYQFLNFLLRPDIAKKVSLSIHYPTANLTARAELPDAIKNNPVLYPSYETLHRGEFQSDHGDQAPMLLEKYWEQLKMSG